MPGAAICVRGLSHRFESRHGTVGVLDGLDLDVGAGDHVALMGPSGSGKSTLLALLGGLEVPQAGNVEVDGASLGSLSSDDLAAFRRQTVGFVFQHFGLLDSLTAAENVALAATLAGTRPTARRVRAAELLDAVGLADRRSHRPLELSGGERQRVAIARALANHPRLVLADEPSGNLDDDNTERVVELLESLPADHGCTLVIVTHDRAIAARAPHAYELRHGRLEPSHPSFLAATVPSGGTQLPRTGRVANDLA